MAVEVRDFGKKFRLYRDKNQTLKTAVLRGSRAKYEELWAVRHVDLAVPQGTTFGLIGNNGSGKSTLLRCLARILRPDEGTMAVRGRVAALLELGSGFHPELTGRQNVFLNGTILGMKRRELERRFDDLVAFAGLERAIDQPVKNYSSGMYARLGFAVATSVDPEVLLVDEVLAVGDVAFQRRCMERINELRSDGRTVVIVSHDATAIRGLCDSAAWLERGVLRETGPVGDVLDHYLRSTAEERPAVADDADRWGNGDVLLDEVTLVDDEGHKVSAVASGQPVAVRIAWSAKQSVPDLVVGLGLWAADGTHLWGASTSDRGVGLDTAAGRGVLTVRIPRLVLQPGPFWIDATAHDPTGAHVYDYRRHAVRLTVIDGGAGEHGGYVSLASEWENG